MARQRWTLALIIICVPILATVITAFRVRDLPKTLQELKTEFKKQKCDDCEVNEPKVVLKHSVTIETVKRHEDSKKSATDKQQKIKSSDSKLSFKFVDDSADDDDDDDDVHSFKSATGFRKEEHLKITKTGTGGMELKSGTGIKSTVSQKVDDDDDNDDDNDDDDDILVAQKKIKVVVKNKVDSDTKPNIKGVNKQDKDNDDDDEIDEKFEMKDAKKQVDSLTKQKPRTVSTGQKSKIDDDVDDDDADDDDDDKIHKTQAESKIKIHLLNKQKPATKLLIKKNKFNEDDDEDDGDDDNDHDEDVIKKQQASTKPNTEKKSPTKELKDYKTEPLKKSDTKDEKSKNDKINLKPTVEHVEKHHKESEPVRELKAPATKQKAGEIFKKQDPVKSKPIEVNKDEKKEQKIEKTLQKEPVKKPKEPEKEKPKSQDQKEIKTKHHEEPKKVAKKPPSESKEKIDKPKAEAKKVTKVDSGRSKHIEKDLGKKDKSSMEMLVESGEFFSTKSESHLHELNEVLQRRNLLQSEFEDYYAFFPTFAPNYSRIHNAECRRHGQILLRQLRGTKLWALNMLDATAKIPSGVLQGNGIQLGDFDQCLGSRARVQLDTGSVVKIEGKYCLARLDVKAEHPELEVPVHLAQAKNLLKSRIDDPGHFVPRFSTLSWGVCVPSACNPEDVEVIIKDAIKHYQHKSGVAIRLKVDEQDCHTQEDDDWENWLELPTVLTLSFYGIIILLVLIATAQDFMGRRKPDEGQDGESGDGQNGGGDEQAECNHKESQDSEEKEAEAPVKTAEDGLLSAFSLYRTIDKLIAPVTSDEITCIHGVRGIATIALLVAHKFLPIAVMPFTNRLRITEVLSSAVWSWCRAGWMYTDCFLLLSGALTAHRISDSDTGAPWRLFSRYLRLTPALLAVVLFYAYVWDNLTTGPMWGSLVTKNAEVCQTGWWWNLLYVQNYFGFEDMCAPQTHQLALDMQLTILSGMLVWTMQAKEVYFRMLVPALHVLSAYSRYTTVRDHRLTLLAYHGATVSQLYRTARLSYVSTFHRCTPYLIGLSLGLALRKPSQLNKFVRILGWILSATLWCSVWYAGMDSGYTTYKYSSTFAAQYAAFAPIASAVAVAWLIYAVHSGKNGFMSGLLCCWPLVLISRLSYALYLCQFIVFLTHAGTVKTSAEFSMETFFDVRELSGILISSTILTLTFVIPMQSLHKVFTFSSKKEESEGQEEKNETEGETEQEKTEETKVDKPEKEEEEIIEVPQIRNRHFMAHREVLEEIPEVDIEYEMQRETHRDEGLEEILEEEEDDAEEEEMEDRVDDDDLEIIEEEQDQEQEQGGEDDFWADREEDVPRRAYSRQDDDVDEWEWSANGSGRNGAQYFRYTR